MANYCLIFLGAGQLNKKYIPDNFVASKMFNLSMTSKKFIRLKEISFFFSFTLSYGETRNIYFQFSNFSTLKLPPFVMLWCFKEFHFCSKNESNICSMLLVEKVFCNLAVNITQRAQSLQRKTREILLFANSEFTDVLLLLKVRKMTKLVSWWPC